MNLHGVCNSARPTSRWTPKAHCMMGKTQWRHCERSFGTNVLVFDKQSQYLSLAVPTSKKDVHKKCRYRTSSELENSIQEINHVTNVTTVLDETAASDRVSRYQNWISTWLFVCVNVCMYTHEYMYVYKYIYTCIHAYKLYIFLCSITSDLYTNIYIHTHVCIDINKCKYKCICIYIHMYMFIYTYVYQNIHIYI